MTTNQEKQNYYPRLSEVGTWKFKRNSIAGPWQWYYYIHIDDKNYHVTAERVSIDYEDGSYTYTNVTPRTMFPEADRELTDDQLVRIVTMPIEGKTYSKEEMNEFLQRYSESLQKGVADDPLEFFPERHGS